MKPLKRPQQSSSRNKGARPTGKLSCLARWLVKETRRALRPRCVRLYLPPNASPARVAEIRGRIARRIQAGYPVQAFPTQLLDTLTGTPPTGCPFAGIPILSMLHSPDQQDNATTNLAEHLVLVPYRVSVGNRAQSCGMVLIPTINIQQLVRVLQWRKHPKSSLFQGNYILASPDGGMV
jgi:hypothetical protein